MTTSTRQPGFAACLRRALSPFLAASLPRHHDGLAHQLAGIPVLALTGEPRLTQARLRYHHSRQIGAARH